MFKRLAFLTLALLLLGGASALVWSQTDCDFSYSNYARAVQLHDMGDYARALRHYECARLEDPDSAIIPLLIENLHQDSADSNSAWSGLRDSVQQQICNPDLDHRRLGEAAYSRGDSDQALIQLQCVLLQEPTDQAALNLMGRIHIDRGATHTAQHYFDRAEAARKSAGELPDIARDSARTYEFKPPAKFEMPVWLTPYETVLDTRGQRHVEPSVDFINRSRQLSQPEQQAVITEAEPLLDPREQAEAALKARDLDSAIDWMLKVAARADVTVADYDFLASLHSMSGDMAGAERSLVQALELAPTRLDLRCRLGIVYVAKGETEAAFAQFDWVLSVDVANICANEHRRALNRSLNAAASVLPAVEPIASPAQATFERGLLMLDERKLFAAANIFMEALALDPAHISARCQLGVIMTEWSNYGAALAHFKRILAEEPQNECARRNRRVAVLDMLAMYIPLTVDDFFFRARTLADIEAWEPAADAIRRGLELDPARNDMRCNLGMIYAQLGDAQAALGEFDRLLARNEVDSCAWSGRDALMQRLRDQR